MRTPVAIVVYNRPDLTGLLFERIRALKPSRLFIIADGPRLDQPGDLERCRQTLEIVEKIDWPCQVSRDYSERNLGQFDRLSSGLGWLFAQEERAIILEDDCLPEPTFFRFCDELLRRFENEPRVMMINGTNVGESWKSSLQSYHFSFRGNVWGWATWRRAWQHYDPTMAHWADPAVRAHACGLLGREHGQAFRNWLQGAYKLRNDWSLPWVFALLEREAVSVVPSVNLIKNLGFRSDATHTTKHNPVLADAVTHEMQFPLRHPAGPVQADVDYDARLFRLRHRPKAAS